LKAFIEMIHVSKRLTATIEQLVAAERVRALYAAIKVAAVSGPIGLVVLSALFWQVIDHRKILTWAIVSAIIICPLSLLLFAHFQRNNKLPHDSQYWLRIATVRFFIVAVSFGSAGFALFAPESITYQMILFCFLTALASTQTVESAQDRWLYMTGMPAFLLPFIVRAAMESDRVTRILAILASAALIYVIPTARNLSKLIHESLINRFKNLDLIEQLQLQKGIAEQSRDDANRARQFAEDAGLHAETARREAVEANRAKSRFLAAASHDLRQPMHALGLFANAVRAHVSSDQGQHIVDKIEASVNSTEVMFNALLDVSRLDAGILVPDIKPIALSEMLARLGNEYAPRAHAKALTLKIRPCDYRVLSDPSLLERVIRNYLSNAIRYTQQGGIVVGYRLRGASLKIEVWDTGTGIATDKLQDIFQEFYQIGNPERNKAKGLGLGLAIVKRIGELLGHPIEVKSRMGRGSKFSVELPLTHDETSLPIIDGDRALEFTNLVGATILVIEDETSVLDAIEIVLKQWGCHVLAAQSGIEALEKLHQHDSAPNVILCDYRLRDEETGIAAIQAIHRQWGAIPAALITGDTAPDRLKEATESGYELLHKPLNPARLKFVLCRMLTVASPEGASSLRPST
jgi:two-component system, sensor histidine kinase